MGKKSHLLQMRGLKLFHTKYDLLIKSHLLQMRGLKLTKCCYFHVSKSRIFYRCVD